VNLFFLVLARTEVLDVNMVLGHVKNCEPKFFVVKKYVN